METGHGKLAFGHGATPTPESANDVTHCQEFIGLHVNVNVNVNPVCPIGLHVITKKMQCIRDPSRFDDFLAGIDTCDFNFDTICICETWRGDDSESWTTTLGHKLFISRSSTHCGVGIGIGRKFAFEMFHVHFQNYSDRVCALYAPIFFSPIFNVKFQFFLYTFRFSENTMR